MIGKEVLDEKQIPLAEVRLILKKRAEDGELNYEQKVSYDYVKEFGKASSAKVNAALEKLKEMGVPDKEAIEIVDIQPKSKEELSLIFEKMKFDVEGNHKKILSLVKELK